MAVVKTIPAHVISYIAQHDLVVLRRKRDNVALNVSFTVQGLKWTCNKLGRALMFRRAFVSQGRIVPAPNTKLELATDVYVEKFIPRNHETEEAQVAEYMWINKALRLYDIRIDNFNVQAYRRPVSEHDK